MSLEIPELPEAIPQKSDSFIPMMFWKTPIVRFNLAGLGLTVLSLLYSFNPLLLLVLGFFITGLLVNCFEWWLSYREFMNAKDNASKLFSSAIINDVYAGIDLDPERWVATFNYFYGNKEIRDFTFSILRGSRANIRYEFSGRAFWEFKAGIPENTPAILKYFILCMSSVLINNLRDARFITKDDEIIFRSHWFDLHKDIIMVLDRKRTFLGLLENPPPNTQSGMSFAPGTWQRRLRLMFNKSARDVPDIREFSRGIMAYPASNEVSEPVTIDTGLWKLEGVDGSLEIIKSNKGYDVTMVMPDGQRGESISFKSMEDVHATWGHLLPQATH